MAEKAGKAVPKYRTDPSSGGKTASLKGRETASGKNGGKEHTDSPMSSEKSGKGASLNKTGKAGRSTLGKQQTAKTAIKVEARIEDEIPKDAKCLMDSEAAIILDSIKEQLQVLADDPMVKIPKSFDLGLQYAKSSARYSKPESVKQVREYPSNVAGPEPWLALTSIVGQLKLILLILNFIYRVLSNYKLSDVEICLIGNTCPEKVDEVYSLVPSVKTKALMQDETIKDMLANLAKFQDAK